VAGRQGEFLIAVRRTLLIARDAIKQAAAEHTALLVENEFVKFLAVLFGIMGGFLS
jgi:hypothetical protein